MINIRISHVFAYLSFLNVLILENALTIVSWIASAQSWSSAKIVLAVEYSCLSESRINVPNCSLVTLTPPSLVCRHSFLHRLDGQRCKISLVLVNYFKYFYSAKYCAIVQSFYVLSMADSHSNIATLIFFLLLVYKWIPEISNLCASS